MGWKLVWPTLVFEYLPWLTSFWMKFVLPSQIFHPYMLGFFVVCHRTKIRFEHKHDLSTNCNVLLFFVAKLRGGGLEEPLYTNLSK